jgi:glutamine amidotransferase
MITIIDSGIANIGSILTACQRIGVQAMVTTEPDIISVARALILPGVGAFADAMNIIRRRGLVQPIRDVAAAGIPILGICLGMQLLSESSEEFGEYEGIGLIPGRVKRLQPAHSSERVPNIGWCDVTKAPNSALFASIDNRSPFYFVHSYAFNCTDPDDCIGSISFGATPVCAAIEHNNIFGVQFHPEKSQDVGLQLLSNFAGLVS